jgi:hypothetical protein
MCTGPETIGAEGAGAATIGEIVTGAWVVSAGGASSGEIGPVGVCAPWFATVVVDAGVMDWDVVRVGVDPGTIAGVTEVAGVAAGTGAAVDVAVPVEEVVSGAGVVV